MSLRSNTPRNRVLALHEDEMVTKQSHKKECDIHEILKQYQKTGIINHINSREGAFTDLPEALDYQAALELVRDAQEGFSELPSLVRERFNNDPYELLAAIGNPELRPELVELGIINAPAPGTGAMPLPTAAPAPQGTTSPTAKPDGVS